MSTVTVEQQFDGNHAVYVDGIYRFAGDEAACDEWVAVTIVKPAKDREVQDGALDRAVGVVGQ